MARGNSISTEIRVLTKVYHKSGKWIKLEESLLSLIPKLADYSEFSHSVWINSGWCSYLNIDLTNNNYKIKYLQ